MAINATPMRLHMSLIQRGQPEASLGGSACWLQGYLRMPRGCYGNGMTYWFIWKQNWS